MTDDIERIAGDRTQAEALRLAGEYLQRAGWKYSPADIGKTAAAIIAPLRDYLKGNSHAE